MWERLIFIQSIQGHAHEGHTVFHGSRYPDTSIDDISKAIRMDTAWVRAARQELIDEVSVYVDKVIGGEEKPALANGDGVGLIGSSMFRDFDVSGHDVLRGLYLGRVSRQSEVRFEMERKVRRGHRGRRMLP